MSSINFSKSLVSNLSAKNCFEEVQQIEFNRQFYQLSIGQQSTTYESLVFAKLQHFSFSLKHRNYLAKLEFRKNSKLHEKVKSLLSISSATLNKYSIHFEFRLREQRGKIINNQMIYKSRQQN